MISKVDICNKALGLIGAKTISSLTEATEQARRCNAVYDFVRQEVLRDHQWGFAGIIDTLAQISNETVPGWDYLYIYPATCLKMRKVFENTEDTNPDQVEWREILSPTTKQKAIVANISPAYAEYTLDVTDPNLFDAQFIGALALRIAAEVAHPLKGSTDMAKEMLGNYLAAVSDAKKNNAMEKNIPAKKKSSYIDARA